MFKEELVPPVVAPSLKLISTFLLLICCDPDPDTGENLYSSLPPSVCLCVSQDILFMLSHRGYQGSVCVDLCGRAAAAAARLSLRAEGVTFCSDSASIKLELSSL